MDKNNPNLQEMSIDLVEENWRLAQERMAGVLATLRAGRPLMWEDAQAADKPLTDIGASLNYLAKAPDEPPPAPAEPSVSSFQREFNDFVAEYMDDHGLKEELLEGESVEFTMELTVEEHTTSHDCQALKVPAALLEKVDDIVERFKDDIEENGREWEVFSASCVDNETLESSMTIERVRKPVGFGGLAGG